ncbi:MAG: hypothetical protein H5U36_01115 [Candidatus Caldatribacterium sp.]|nr:hypothetical protein [Candidatus Caldatribacterium sp.]
MVSKRVSLVLFSLIAVLFLSGPVCGKEFIDLFCPGVERKEAILTCAFQAGVEVVFLEPVSGTVNLRKDHVRFEEALSLILKGSGVSWFRANGVYYIGTPSSTEFLRDGIPLERYDLHFVKAEEVIRALPQYRDALVPGGEYLLFVLGEEPKRRSILEKVKALDAPKPHILVRALVVEGRKEELEQLGITFPKDTVSITVQEVDLGGPLARLETLKAYLEGLAEEGKVTVRSEAEILVLEGEEGEVSTTGEVYYPIQSGSQREVLSVERLDVGTTLKVRPHRIAENTLLLDVTLATKNLAKTRRTALSVIQRTFQTSVIAQEGKVISIAGLEEEGKERVSRKRTAHRTREEGKKLVLFLQAEKEQSPSRETIASVKARGEIVVQEPGPLHNMELLAFSASLVGKHCALPWLGIGLKWQEDISWRLEGNLLLAPSEGGKGELELRYYPQKMNTWR